MYCFVLFLFLFRFKLERYEDALGPPDLSVLNEEANVASPVSEVAVPAVATAPPLVREEPVAPIPVRPLLDLARGRIDEEGAAEIGAWLPSAGWVGLGLFAGCLLCGLVVLATVMWRRYQRQR